MIYEPGDILISYTGNYYLVVDKPNNAYLLVRCLAEGLPPEDVSCSLDPDVELVTSMFRETDV